MSRRMHYAMKSCSRTSSAHPGARPFRPLYHQALEKTTMGLHIPVSTVRGMSYPGVRVWSVWGIAPVNLPVQSESSASQPSPHELGKRNSTSIEGRQKPEAGEETNLDEKTKCGSAPDPGPAIKVARAAPSRAGAEDPDGSPAQPNYGYTKSSSPHVTKPASPAGLSISWPWSPVSAFE
ncbi:hypothetical protein LZ30DRAFT_20681 [Colletotrichum cereale]|nr:hypothetical protein LZ30DRAFT_20681 [Colletotrichum cereale]